MAKRDLPARTAKRNAAHEVRKGKGRAKTRAGGLRIIDDPKTDERRLALQLQSMGLYACHTLGDGNCLFRALSDQLHGTPNYHAKVREEVCAHLERNEAKYKAFVDIDEGGSWEGHLRDMRRNGTYGGHLELSAFAHLHRRPIKVIQPGLVYIIGHEDESPSALKRRAEKETRRLLRGSRPPASSSSGSGSASGRMRSSTVTLKASKKGKAKEEDSEDRMVEDDDQSAELDDEDVESEEHTGDTTEEEFGEDSPLYIIYHQWEHYSSVRNIDGPHVGPPRIRERKPTFLESPGSSQETNSREDSVATDETDLLRKSLPADVGARLSDGDLLKLIEVHGSWERTLEVLLDDDAQREQRRGGRTSPFKAALVPSTTQHVQPSPILIRVRKPPTSRAHSPSKDATGADVTTYREGSPSTSSSTATDSNHHSSASTDPVSHHPATTTVTAIKVNGRPSTRSQDPRPSSSLQRSLTPADLARYDARSPPSSGRNKPKSRSRSPSPAASPDEGVGRRLRRRPLLRSDDEDDDDDDSGASSGPETGPGGFQHINTVSADLDASNERPTRLRNRMTVHGPPVAASSSASGMSSPSAAATPSSSSASGASSPLPSRMPGAGLGGVPSKKAIVVVKRDRKEERKARKREKETLARRAAVAAAVHHQTRKGSGLGGAGTPAPETAALFKELRV